MVTVDGSTFFPSTVENVIRGFREVGEFAVDIRRRGGRDAVEVRVELSGDDAGAVGARVARALGEALGLRVDVSAVGRGTLPRFPVKAARVTDHRAAG